MQKKATVTDVQTNGTRQDKNGNLYYKYEVTFDNNDTGEYSSKSQDQNKFIVGEETDYEFIDGRYPKVKPVYMQKGVHVPNKSFLPKDNNVQEYIVKQSSLKCATDYVIANGGDSSKVIEIAEMFTDWVLKGTKPTNDTKQDLPF